MEYLTYQPKRLAKRTKPNKYQPRYHNGEVVRMDWGAFFKRLCKLGKKCLHAFLTHVISTLKTVNRAIRQFVERIGVNKVIDIYLIICIALILVIIVTCFLKADMAVKAVEKDQKSQEVIDEILLEESNIDLIYDPKTGIIAPLNTSAMPVIEEVDIPEESVIEEPVVEEPIIEEPEPVVETEPILNITGEADSVTPLAEQLNPEGVTLSYLGVYHITGYDPLCNHCCGKSDGITASGEPAEYYKTVAMNGIPFGTKIYIPTYGVFVVEDTGGKSVGVDIACPGHEACYAVTNAGMDVYIVTEE